MRPASSFHRSTASVSCSARQRLEQRLDQLEQLGRGRVRVGARPADDRLARLVRELALELRPRLLGGDDDQLRSAQPADLPVDLLGDLLQVVMDELLDVPLVARLRPAALVVAAGRVVVLLDDLLEPAGPQAVEVAALAADEDHQRALAAADQRDERREVEAAVDLDRIGDARAQRQRHPEVVQRAAEDGAGRACRRGRTPARSTRAGDRGRGAAPPAARASARAAVPPSERSISSISAFTRVSVVGGGRRVARIEVDVEADRAAVLRPKAREVAQAVPRHCRGHRESLRRKAAILFIRFRASCSSALERKV